MSKDKTQPNTEGPESPGAPYTVKIVCAKRGCKQVRWIKPQDAFQTKLCREHAAEAKRDKRRAKAAERAKARKAAKSKSTTKGRVEVAA